MRISFFFFLEKSIDVLSIFLSRARFSETYWYLVLFFSELSVLRCAEFGVSSVQGRTKSKVQHSKMTLGTTVFWVRKIPERWKQCKRKWGDATEGRAWVSISFSWVITRLGSMFRGWKQRTGTGAVSRIGSKPWLISGLIYANASNRHLSLSPPPLFSFSGSECNLLTA